ncbi:DUF6233 domain-containing protein [Streptomyces brasiliscabiei]|uniref:DUF6233 domain-containing protein n=1 Tax=Streptomyces brasiliscabiei TaxID=2736302 RepID=UPI0038F79B7B
MADTPSEPPPITVVLPDDQEVTGRLHERQQTPEGWLYKVSVPAWMVQDGQVVPSWYTVWVQAPAHVKPVDGVSYDDVPTERLENPSAVREILGPRRPSGWVLQKMGGGRGPGRGVVHAVDCDEAPAGAPPLTLDQALDAAEHPGVRLCALCGAAAELDPVLRGFDHGGDSGES